MIFIEAILFLTVAPLLLIAVGLVWMAGSTKCWPVCWDVEAFLCSCLGEGFFVSATQCA
jgi:hypothetical protein